MGEGLRRMMEMDSSETMMDLATKANNRTAFAAGMENYAEAAWDYIGRVEYGVVSDMMEAYRIDKDAFWGKLSAVVFDGTSGLAKITRGLPA